MTNHHSHDWAPDLSDFDEAQAALVASTQPHIVALTRRMVDIEDAHFLTHQHPFIPTDPDRCKLVAQVLEDIDTRIDRGILAMWS